MSSILEALKKLEEEKATRRGTASNISGKITASGRRDRPRPAWAVPAGMAAVAAVAAIATYAAMGGFSRSPVEPISGKGAEPASGAMSAPATPARADKGFLKKISPHGRVSPPVERTTVGNDSVRPAPVSPPSAQPVLSPTPPRQGGSTEQAASPSPAVDSSSPPALKVTGIAWQKDSASRLAVVNGISVAEGAVIAGAHVKEILPDRVLFSFAKKEFAVFLGKGTE